MTQPQTFTLTQTAQHIGISRKTLYNMLQDGRFPVAPVHRSKPRRWHVADIERWLANDETSNLREGE